MERITQDDRIHIGLEFKHYRLKHNRDRKVVDVHTTTNNIGEVVKIEYVTVHEFMGQTIKETMPASTIIRSLPARQGKEQDAPCN